TDLSLLVSVPTDYTNLHPRDLCTRRIYTKCMTARLSSHDLSLLVSVPTDYTNLHPRDL
ncbi:hypothetical protein J6590_081871, partial [Homalodisca vitripennis]